MPKFKRGDRVVIRDAETELWSDHWDVVLTYGHRTRGGHLVEWPLSGATEFARFVKPAPEVKT